MNIIDIALELAEAGLIENENYEKNEVRFGRSEGTPGADFEGWKIE